MAGKSVFIVGSGQIRQATAAKIAELCRVVLKKRASGAFNIGDPGPPTVREIGAAMGRRYDIVGLPRHPEGAVGATPWSVPRPFLIDTGKAEALGYRPVVSYADTVAATSRDLIERTAGRSWREVFPGLVAYRDPWFDHAAEDAFFGR